MHLTLQRDALRRELDTVEGTAPISMCLTDRVGSRYRQNDARKYVVGSNRDGKSYRVFVKETGEEISLVRGAGCSTCELEEESS